MSNRGMVMLARAAFDYELFEGDSFSRREAWLYMFSEASWRTRTVTPVPRLTVQIERGELAVSIRALARKFRWSGPAVQRLLDLLEKEGMITRRIAHSGTANCTVIRVVNYEHYQSAQATPKTKTDALPTHPYSGGTACGSGASVASAGRPDTHPIQREEKSRYAEQDTLAGDKSVAAPPLLPPSNGTAVHLLIQGRPRKRHTFKKEEEEKKDRSCSSSTDEAAVWPHDAFDQWYRIYPRKRQPKDAKRAFQKVAASGEVTFAELMVRTRVHTKVWSSWPNDRHTFIPYPASFLNKGDYLSEPDGAKSLAVPLSDRIAPRLPQSFSEQEWRTIVRQHEHTGKWTSEYWGPPPGEPGCCVPPALLVKSPEVASARR
jgi:hypothetical protein